MISYYIAAILKPNIVPIFDLDRQEILVINIDIIFHYKLQHILVSYIASSVLEINIAILYGACYPNTCIWPNIGRRWIK